MLRLNRSAAPSRPLASAAVARIRLQRALGADRHVDARAPRVAGALPCPPCAPPPAPDDLLGRLLGEPLACDRRRP
jgi:hypothetical protein